jgi:hypothetical protein
VGHVGDGVVETEPPDWMRMFRSYSVFGEWADVGSGKQQMGMTTVKIEAQLAFPFFTEKSPLLVTPSHETRFIQWKGTADFPDVVHASEIHFRWIRPLTERFKGTLAVAPSWNSDYNQDIGDALRIARRSFSEFLISIVPISVSSRSEESCGDRTRISRSTFSFPSRKSPSASGGGENPIPRRRRIGSTWAGGSRGESGRYGVPIPLAMWPVIAITASFSEPSGERRIPSTK